MQEIYIRLLGEGTTVYRPVKASKIDDSTFAILEENEIDLNDEDWEFLPGSTVIVEAIDIGGNVRLIATKLATKTP